MADMGYANAMRDIHSAAHGGAATYLTPACIAVVENVPIEDARRALIAQRAAADTNKLEFFTRNLGTTVFRTAEEVEAYNTRLDASTAASKRLADITAQLQDERDRANGNEAQIEQRRYAAQEAEITALIEQQNAAQAVGNASLAERAAGGQEALVLARKAHQERMAQLKEEEQQRIATKDAATGQQTASTQPPRPAQSSTQSTANGPAVINQTNNFEITGIFAGSMNELARLLKPELDKIARLSQ